ncbi:MAG: TonB-dependent receptor, partial [Alphaproteobacteria bacterium]|nr:TonB-dependent receptor [Alphaproteobacteria bacterium]
AARLFNAQSRIRETRLEPFASLNWQIGASMFVDLAVDYERSKFKQTGRDVNNRRKLSYVKPRADVRYDFDSLTQLRIGVGRTVSQLDFADFLTSFEADDSQTGVIRAGNPNIVPEKIWATSATLERRLANDGGLVSMRAFREDYADHIEVIPVANGTLAAPGNIGSGYDHGIEFKGSLRLDRFGIAGAVIEASTLWRKTNVTDPFTGESRWLRDIPDSQWLVRFRQDFDWRSLSYGVTVEDEGRRDQFELIFMNAFYRAIDFQAFVEMQPVAGVTARLEAFRVLRTGAERERLTYVGNRGRGILLRRELRDIKFHRDVKFTLRGAF